VVWRGKVKETNEKNEKIINMINDLMKNVKAK